MIKAKIKKKLITMFLMFVVFFSILPAAPISTPLAITTQAAVSINVSKKTLCKGDTYTLTITGTTTKATWKSSNTAVATVDSNGKVTAKKKGTATITGTIGKNSYSCIVTVTNGYIKPRQTAVTVTVGKTVTVWIDTKNVSELTMESSDDEVYFDWGSWKEYAVPIKIKGLYPGTATIKVYDETDTNISAAIKVTVKPAAAKTYGDVKGKVTYLYSKSRGRVPDTNARILLIPKNKNAKNSTVKSSEFTALSSSLSKKYIYTAKANKNGNYTISNVPTGNYLAIIISGNANNKKWYDAPNVNTFYSDRAKKFKSVLSDYTALELSKSIGKYKCLIGTVTVYNGKASTFSYAFGYSYTKK